MNTSEVLYQAADLIERQGWTSGGGWNLAGGPHKGPLCAEGAIITASSGRLRERRTAIDAVQDYLNNRSPECINRLLGYVIVWSWNDRPERTAAEVIEVLRAAAIIEAARENATVPDEVTA